MDTGKDSAHNSHCYLLSERCGKVSEVGEVGEGGCGFSYTRFTVIMLTYLKNCTQIMKFLILHAHYFSGSELNSKLI